MTLEVSEIGGKARSESEQASHSANGSAHRGADRNGRRARGCRERELPAALSLQVSPYRWGRVSQLGRQIAGLFATFRWGRMSHRNERLLGALTKSTNCDIVCRHPRQGDCAGSLQVRHIRPNQRLGLGLWIRATFQDPDLEW